MRFITKAHTRGNTGLNLSTASYALFAYEEVTLADTNFCNYDLHRCTTHYQSAGFLMSSALTFKQLATPKIPTIVAENALFFYREEQWSDAITLLCEETDAAETIDKLGGDQGTYHVGQEITPSQPSMSHNHKPLDFKNNLNTAPNLALAVFGDNADAASGVSLISLTNDVRDYSSLVTDPELSSYGFDNDSIDDIVMGEATCFISCDVQILRWFILGCENMNSLEIGALIRYRRASKKLRKHTRGKSRVLSNLELVPYYRYWGTMIRLHKLIALSIENDVFVSYKTSVACSFYHELVEMGADIGELELLHIQWQMFEGFSSGLYSSALS
jgi:hypothetical protein